MIYGSSSLYFSTILFCSDKGGTGTNILENKVDLNKSKKYVTEEEHFLKYKHLTLNKGDIVIVKASAQKTGFLKTNPEELTASSSSMIVNSGNSK